MKLVDFGQKNGWLQIRLIFRIFENGIDWA